MGLRVLSFGFRVQVLWLGVFCFVGIPMRTPSSIGTSLGTPNPEPQEYRRNIIGIYLPGFLDIQSLDVGFSLFSR